MIVLLSSWWHCTARLWLQWSHLCAQGVKIIAHFYILRREVCRIPCQEMASVKPQHAVESGMGVREYHFMPAHDGFTEAISCVTGRLAIFSIHPYRQWLHWSHILHARQKGNFVNMPVHTMASLKPYLTTRLQMTFEQYTHTHNGFTEAIFQLKWP